MKIIEYTNFATTSTKQFIWCGSQRCEERDGTGALTRRFFERGETITGTSYFFARDHLGSIRQVVHNNGTTQAEYNYGPYGEKQVVSETVSSDFQYAGYYFHNRSGLNLALYRTYNSALGRWLSRDPKEEDAGVNVFAYVGNNPVSSVDPLGLQQAPPGPGTDLKTWIEVIVVGTIIIIIIIVTRPEFPPGKPPDPRDPDKPLPRRNKCEADCYDQYENCWDQCCRIYPKDAENRRKCQWLCWMDIYVPCMRNCPGNSQPKP